MEPASSRLIPVFINWPLGIVNLHKDPRPADNTVAKRELSLTRYFGLDYRGQQ